MIAVSSLAWGGELDPAMLATVAAEGIHGVELAPTAIWGTTDWPSGTELRAARAACEDAGLRVSSIQSILYGRPDLLLFDRPSWPALRDHLVRMADVASALGAAVAVFGSPRNRLRGELPVGDAVVIAAEFFRDLADEFSHRSVTLTLEPNPREYGADFMTTYAEVLDVTDEVDHPAVRPQIDVGCLSLSGDDPAACVALRVPAHVHLSAPGLGAPPAPGIDYEAVVRALAASAYHGWCTVEMLRHQLSGPDEVLDAVRWAVELDR